MQSIVLSVFAVGTILGSGAAVMQHAYERQNTEPEIITQTQEPQLAVTKPTTQLDVCQPVRFRIYFPKESAQIDAAGRALIARALDNVLDCDAVSIMIGAPDPILSSSVQRVEASKRSAALLAELEASGLNGNVYVAREGDVLNGPGAYIDPPNASTPDYIAVSIQPKGAEPVTGSEPSGLKT